MSANKNTETPVEEKKGISCPKRKRGGLAKGDFKTALSSAAVPQKTKKPEVVQMRKHLPKAKYYIFTAAQNATPIQKPTWQTLLRIRDYYDAVMCVLPGRYKNPTSQWTQNNMDHEWWDPEVMPYLCNGRMKLNESILVLGDVKVEWASHAPLTGMDAFTKEKSGIVGHGSRSLRSIATPQNKYPKIMLTTGTCTADNNYTDTKRGKLGNFAHCLGGLIVEIDDDRFYVRQLNATERGHIIDLDLEFTPDEVRPAKRALSVSMGDIHQRWVCPDVVNATFTAPDSLVKILNPRYIFWHDVIDFHSRNHHHKDDWVTQYAKWKHRIECVRTEIQDAIQFVNDHTAKNQQSIIISSNHDRAIARWLKDADFRRDPVNAKFYLECAQRAIESARMTNGGVTFDDPFMHYAQKITKENVRFLKQGESMILARVEYGFHGDIGPNGSRGNTKNLSRLGIKVTKGHSHTAEIIDGCYSAGKSTGMLEYEMGGPSSHTNSHVVQYANGKRVLIFIIDGRFCLPRPQKNEGK
jgi:hypothetical protein